MQVKRTDLLYGDHPIVDSEGSSAPSKPHAPISEPEMTAEASQKNEKVSFFCFVCMYVCMYLCMYVDSEGAHF